MLTVATHCLGTIFLWIFWPSFNSAPTALGDGQHRTALNTYYSLTASTLSTFALSALVSEDGRLDMVGGSRRAACKGKRGMRAGESSSQMTAEATGMGGAGMGAGVMI